MLGTYLHCHTLNGWHLSIQSFCWFCMYCISLLQLSTNERVPAYNCRCVSRKGLGQRIGFGQRVVLVLLKLMIMIWMWVLLETCPLFVWLPDSVDYFTVLWNPQAQGLCHVQREIGCLCSPGLMPLPLIERYRSNMSSWTIWGYVCRVVGSSEAVHCGYSSRRHSDGVGHFDNGK